jgi:hypothetical protein
MYSRYRVISVLTAGHAGAKRPANPAVKAAEESIREKPGCCHSLTVDPDRLRFAIRTLTITSRINLAFAA